MKFASRIAVALVAVLAVSLSFAQDGGNRRQRGGMQGRNMTTLTGLALRDDVQAALKVSDAQRTKLTELRPQRGQRGQGGNGGNGGAGQGGQRQRGEGAGAIDPARMAARQKEEQDKLAAILDASQMKRLGEIRLQMIGAQAIAMPDVQTQLGLSETQKAKVADLQKTYREAMQSVREKVQSGEIERSAMRDAMTKNTDVLKAELAKVLTAEQAEKLKALGGEPFKADN